MLKLFRFSFLGTRLALKIVFLWLFFGMLGGLIPTGDKTRYAGQQIDVMLVGGKIHYDILLPANIQTRSALRFTRDAGIPTDHPGVKWFLVGWGAEQFYTSAGDYTDVKAGDVLRAITGDDSVLRVDALGELRPDIDAHTISLSSVQYNALLASITESFSRDGFGRPQVLDHPGFTQTDRFFHAIGRFSALRTCNVWLGEQLRAAGLRFGVWTPTTWSFELSLKEHQTH
ncbi:TIGR02117 family protein [Halocynthiibacter namhaensis]|uniref:TIGR02117 family protein n=1 Tax=Halocynthiibacter namhaensis TaxID=1290553 RepID=UPI00068C8311|nr:TIGR02117 family protein [Halocynthiibacter namhaensis]